MYIKLTDYQDQNVLVPINAHPVFEGIKDDHPKYGQLSSDYGINTLVRVTAGNDFLVLKVKETPDQILKMIQQKKSR